MVGIGAYLKGGNKKYAYDIELDSWNQENKKVDKQNAKQKMQLLTDLFLLHEDENFLQ